MCACDGHEKLAANAIAPTGAATESHPNQLNLHKGAWVECECITRQEKTTKNPNENRMHYPRI
jgi:hypothetical protein